MTSFEYYFEKESDDHVKRERAAAKQLRSSQWWKNRLGNGLCHYCKGRFKPKELTMDHIIPIIRGGTSTRRNVVPCCPKCNQQKKYLLPSEWAEYLDRMAD